MGSCFSKKSNKKATEFISVKFQPNLYRLKMKHTSSAELDSVELPEDRLRKVITRQPILQDLHNNPLYARRIQRQAVDSCL